MGDASVQNVGPVSPQISPDSSSPVDDKDKKPGADEKPDVDPSVVAERFKEKGNEAFKKKQFGEAIDLYTKAIGELRPLSHMFQSLL